MFDLLCKGWRLILSWDYGDSCVIVTVAFLQFGSKLRKNDTDYLFSFPN